MTLEIINEHLFPIRSQTLCLKLKVTNQKYYSHYNNSRIDEFIIFCQPVRQKEIKIIFC